MILAWDAFLKQELDTNIKRTLNQPIRIQLENPNAYREFLLGLRVHHYRAQTQSKANYIDYYYDTVTFDLFDHGFSYRFRTQVQDGSQLNYSLRLEQEPRFVQAESKKIDVMSRLPMSLGAKIANGEWEQAVIFSNGIAAANELRHVLANLDIKPESLRPRMVGELSRERFEVTDKGQNWFELDHESWIYRPIGEWSSLESVDYEDLVLDTRLGSQNPELSRRVRTMYQFANMIDGVKLSDIVPHERAMQAFESARH